MQLFIIEYVTIQFGATCVFSPACHNIMPRGKQLVSLRDTCLTSIVTNMDDLWCKHYLETYAKENRFFRYVVGPFDGLRENYELQTNPPFADVIAAPIFWGFSLGSGLSGFHLYTLVLINFHCSV